MGKNRVSEEYKFGVIGYNTKNLGDEVQSIATMRFLPRVDYVFDRDHISDTKIAKDDKVKLIMNGWYMYNTSGWWFNDGEHQNFDWPPKNKNLLPLPISMYFEQGGQSIGADAVITGDESKAFFQKYGPVGARDLGTQKFLEQNGIESYFSGCLTLTLLPDSRIKKQDFILALDVSDAVYEYLKKNSKRKIIRLNNHRDHKLSFEQKVAVSQYWLYLYQSAHCVVTTRLHAMLPCLALGTPVLALHLKDPRRFAGLIDLTNHCDEKDFLSGKYKYDVDKPPKNPTAYKAVAEKLVKICSDFTGYDSKKSFMDSVELLDSPDFIEAVGIMAEKSDLHFMLEMQNQNLLSERDAKNRRIEELEAALDEALNPGIKRATKDLLRAVKRRLTK